MSTVVGMIRDAMAPESFTMKVAVGLDGTELVLEGPEGFVLKFWLDQPARKSLITLLETAPQYGAT